jgi:hypothetical protein
VLLLLLMLLRRLVLLLLGRLLRRRVHPIRRTWKRLHADGLLLDRLLLLLVLVLLPLLLLRHLLLLLLSGWLLRWRGRKRRRRVHSIRRTFKCARLIGLLDLMLLLLRRLLLLLSERLPRQRGARGHGRRAGRLSRATLRHVDLVSHRWPGAAHETCAPAPAQAPLACRPDARRPNARRHVHGLQPASSLARGASRPQGPGRIQRTPSSELLAQGTSWLWLAAPAIYLHPRRLPYASLVAIDVGVRIYASLYASYRYTV